MPFNSTNSCVSRRILRPLAALSVFCMLAAGPTAGFAQNAQSEAEQLEQAYFTAISARDYPKAIEIGLKLADLAPKGGKASFNLACAYVLNGDRPKGIEYLRRAVKEGFADADAMSKDPDLVTIRSDAEFTALVQEVRNNKQRQIDDFRKKVEAALPVIVAPPKHDPAKPTAVIVALHGEGENAEDIADVFRGVAGEFGAILVAPRAVVDAPVKGYSWEDADGADYIVTRTAEVLKKQFRLDERKIVLAGYSQGGWIAYRLAMRNPRRYCAVIPIAARCDNVTIPSTPLLPKLFVMIGEKDNFLDQNRQLAGKLADKGAAVQIAIYPGLGHEYPKDRDAELRKALTFALGEPVNPPGAAAGAAAAHPPAASAPASAPASEKK